MHVDVATDYVLLFIRIAREAIILCCRVMCSRVYLIGFYDFIISITFVVVCRTVKYIYIYYQH
jgi:hypothetical protein